MLNHTKKLGRSALALLAGIITVIILSVGTDLVMRSFGVLSPIGRRPTDFSLLFALTYRTVYSVGGSYLIARLAPNRPLGHALVSGVFGLVVGTVGAVATWNMPELGAHWYPVALALLAVPSAWLGGTMVPSQRD